MTREIVIVGNAVVNGIDLRRCSAIILAGGASVEGETVAERELVDRVRRKAEKALRKGYMPASIAALIDGWVQEEALRVKAPDLSPAMPRIAMSALTAISKGLDAEKDGKGL